MTVEADRRTTQPTAVETRMLLDTDLHLASKEIAMPATLDALLMHRVMLRRQDRKVSRQQRHNIRLQTRVDLVTADGAAETARSREFGVTPNVDQVAGTTTLDGVLEMGLDLGKGTRVIVGTSTGRKVWRDRLTWPHSATWTTGHDGRNMIRTPVRSIGKLVPVARSTG